MISPLLVCLTADTKTHRVLKRQKMRKEAEKKRRGEDGRMRLISASLLFMADCLRAAGPLCFLVHVWMLQRTERLKKDRHGKHAHWHFLIKYGNQGANQQHSICDPFLIHYQKLCKWGRYWERLSGGERERNGGEGKREREMQVITSLFTDLMRAM